MIQCGDGQFARNLRLIILVINDDAGHACGAVEQFLVFFRDAGRAVDHHDDEVRILQCLDGFFNADLFDRIPGLMNTCGIDQIQCQIIDMHGAFHQVSCGSRNVCDDCLVFLNQRIKQRGLSDIGPSQNDGIEAAAYVDCRLRFFNKSIGFRNPVIDPRQKLFFRQLVHIIVFGIINIHFDHRNDLTQRIHQRLQQFLHASLQSVYGRLRIDFIARLDEIIDRLCLRKIHLSVEECTLGEFPAPCHAGACPKHQ